MSKHGTLKGALAAARGDARAAAPQTFVATPNAQNEDGAEEFLFANAVSNCFLILWAAAGDIGEFEEDEVIGNLSLIHI